MAVLIVEGGVNHEGSYQRALDMMVAAKEAGAQMFKWQLYDATRFLPKKHFLYPNRKDLMRVMESWEDLIKDGHELGLKVGFSVFSKYFWPAHEHADFVKIAARQLDDSAALREYIEYIKLNVDLQKVPVFCSYRDNKDLGLMVQELEGVYLMGVVSKYPHTFKEGLSLISRTEKERAGESYWGVSLHCRDELLIVEAEKKGASFIEVHFTLDHDQSDFRDHKVAFDYFQLSRSIEFLEYYETTKH